MGKSQRNKGHNFERWVASELRPYFPEAKRGFQTRGGTSEEPDVKGCGPFVIECKAHKKVNREAAFAQIASAGYSGMPVAICKDDYQKPVVRLRARDLWFMLLGSDVSFEVELSFEDFKKLCAEVSEYKNEVSNDS